MNRSSSVNRPLVFRFVLARGDSEANRSKWLPTWPASGVRPGLALYQQGVPVLRIAEDLHMSRTTVRKFVAAGAFPERATTLRSNSILDPYVPYLQQRLAEGPVNASQLWRDVREQGFLGGYKVIARWLQAQGWQLRKGRFSQARRMQESFRPTSAPETPPLQEQEQAEQAQDGQRATLEEPVESPRHLVWLLLRDPARLGEKDEHMLTFIRQEPTVELAYTLAQRFIELMHEHQAAQLESWISACTSSGITDLETFAVCGLAEGTLSD